MDKMPTNNRSESSSSDSNNDDNVPKLSHSLEQQQLQANQSGGPRRFFCDRVLFDALHFLQRTEHAHVRLASRRLQWLSDTACARYPPRVVPWLEVRGVSRTLAAGPRMVANSMRVHPPSDGNSSSDDDDDNDNSYLVDFPSVEPPGDIIHLSSLEIYDFVGPELLQFLRLSARLLGKCFISFLDFDNFVRHHSADLISRFFALFPSGANRTMELYRCSSLTTPLFRDHPSMFDCTKLIVECTHTFPLDALQSWLHLDEQHPPEQQQRGRLLLVRFEDKIPAVGHFVQQLKQRFLSATSCCPFTVDIGLFGEDAPELQPFVEHNERTGERLEFNQDPEDHHHPPFYYLMKRRRRESAEQEEGDREAETVEGTATTMVHVYIDEVMQGDKQPPEEDPEAATAGN